MRGLLLHTFNVQPVGFASVKLQLRKQQWKHKPVIVLQRELSAAWRMLINLP